MADDRHLLKFPAKVLMAGSGSWVHEGKRYLGYKLHVEGADGKELNVFEKREIRHNGAMRGHTLDHVADDAVVKEVVQ